MSRAFVRESDQDPGELPERAVSPHPNLVTARGLAALEARVRELEDRRRAARTANDTAALAVIAGDLRYFQARRDSARLVSPLAKAMLGLTTGDEVAVAGPGAVILKIEG